MTLEELTRLLNQQTQYGFTGQAAPISYDQIIQAIQGQYQQPQIQPMQPSIGYGAERFINQPISTPAQFVEYGRQFQQQTPSFIPSVFDIEKYRYTEPVTVSDVVDVISGGGGGDGTGSADSPSTSATSTSSDVSISPSQAMSVVSAVTNANPVALAMAMMNIAISNAGGSSGDSSVSDASNATGISGIGASDAAAATGASSSVGEGAVGGSVSGEGDSGGGGGGAGKIICTAMNHAYGFGSFRNAIWIKYADQHLTKAHEVGYHTMFLPLVDYGFKRGNGRMNMVVRRILEWGTRHRSTDLRAEMRGTKRDTTGRIIRFVFEPLCYIVGKLKGY